MTGIVTPLFHGKPSAILTGAVCFTVGPPRRSGRFTTDAPAAQRRAAPRHREVYFALIPAVAAETADAMPVPCSANVGKVAQAAVPLADVD
jgi:hypothetical protein